MTVINTNTAATLTANALTKNERAMNQTMERLSTGQRINSAADDAAGLAISSKMTSQINGLNMAVRNANDAISKVQTEDGALIEVENMLQRMRTLAVQSVSDTNTSSDRTALNTELSALGAEIQRIGANTQWNGNDLLDGVGTTGAQDFQIGANANQVIQHTFAQVEVTGVASAAPSLSSVAAGGAANVHSFTFHDDGAYAVGDTLTFTIDSVIMNANVTSVDANGDIDGFQFHGSSTVIGENSNDEVVHSNAVVGDITASMTTDNIIKFTGTTAGAGNDFTSSLTNDLSDGTTVANSTASSGVVAGALKVKIDTALNAAKAIETFDFAIAALNTARATSGAVINRLEYAADNLANVSQNASASRSRILDADYAAETTELARTQIIQQAGTAMLSQANQQAQSVLALLK